MTIDEIFKRVQQLPPGLPQIAQEILLAFENNADVDLKVIADKISQDQVIAAKVLRLANSAYFGGARNVATLDQAVVLLGMSALRTLVVASSATGMFPDMPGFDKETFWKHSFQVASLCQKLAKIAGLDANVAFMCGMLHRIGDLLIRMANPSLSADIDSYEEMGACRAESQKNLMGLDYAEVGEALAQRWDFPEVIQHTIAHQLEPQHYEGEENYAALLAVADHLLCSVAKELDESDEEYYPEAAARLLALSRDKVLDRLEEVMEASGEELAVV
ncbi:HDOD domain-containing protein [Porticoccus sp. W117]|uniref:HDOD domain-containing protein n=1 Tax=Porticoccus sp. W117 TaxID=3054777 RepID=UPI002591A1D0|nr:HDOD domain-containing protein [Porticoccus sp. W117]MDM3871607.1 HDOD domain-containing protein [Porticoccus sp. W117]